MDDLRLWDTPNPLVEGVYNTDNYEVIDYGNSNLCYIFFSSNGLFFPDTIKEFEEKVIQKNRYEWKYLASDKELIEVSGRHIFVRDIYKQWYIKGINNEINTIDKLIVMLRELTEGYDVVTVGSSAGGYVAALIASKLSAKFCFNFAGQISLWEFSKTNPFVKDGVNEDNKKKYYDISKIMGESECIYYYFYPLYNDRDVKQFAQIQMYSNVRGFSFSEKNHAAAMLVGNMRYIICKDLESMDLLYKHYKGKTINKIEFLFRTVSTFKAFLILLKEVKRFIDRRLGNKRITR